MKIKKRSFRMERMQMVYVRFAPETCEHVQCIHLRGSICCSLLPQKVAYPYNLPLRTFEWGSVNLPARKGSCLRETKLEDLLCKCRNARESLHCNNSVSVSILPLSILNDAQLRMHDRRGNFQNTMRPWSVFRK